MEEHQNPRQSLGRIGEELACLYLRGLRYRILDRNWRVPGGELDVVARAPDKTLVFVEVKTTGEGSAVRGIEPEDQLTPAKRRRFVRAAQTYLAAHPRALDEARGFRLDLACVVFRGKQHVLRHYENI